MPLADNAAALLKEIPLALVSLDDGHRITDMNGEAAALLGVSATELRGRSIIETLDDGATHLDFLDLIDELDREAQIRPDVSVSTLARDLRFRRPAGGLATLSTTALRLTRADGVRVLALTTSHSDREARSGQLAAFQYDALTGLPTRPLLLATLRTALGRLSRRRGFVGVIFVDLDRMKAINDRLGHEAGDSFLCDIAARMRATLREGDIVARFGGDEFVVAVTDAESPDLISRIAYRLRGVMSEPMVVAGEIIEASASMGVVVTNDATANPEDLIRDADTAMYEGKRSRGGVPVFFDPALRQVASERVRLEADLRRALSSREIETYFQPIVSLDGSIRGAEALVRWQHPERGLVTPGGFIPLAEETGLVQDVWQVVVEDACRCLRIWHLHERHEAAYVSVNLSPRQFRRADLVPRLQEMLGRTGLKPSCVRVEVTETALMEDAVLAHRVLDSFASAGFGLALDDFGTGYSSLSHLQEYPVTMVKIDRSFTRRIPHDPRSTAIVRAIIELGLAIGLEVCAEGVETREQADALAVMNCHLGQGHLWGAAEPASDFSRRLAAS